MVTKSPSVVYRGNPPSALHEPNPIDIVTLFDETLASVDIALGDRTSPYFGAYIGQSNPASTNAQAAGGDLTVNPNIFILVDGAWQVCDPENGVGVPVAGRNLIAFQAGKELLRQGYPAAYLVNDAYPEQPISQWVGSGTESVYYLTLKAKVEAALATPEMVAIGKTSLDGFAMIHGESDNGLSGNTSTRDSYAADIETLKSQLRAETWFDADTPIALTEIGATNGFNLRNDYFRSIALHSDPYVYVTPTSGLDVGGDNTHYTGAAINELGKRTAQNLLALRPRPLIANPNVVSGPLESLLDPVFRKGFYQDYEPVEDEILFGPRNLSQGKILTQALGFSFDTGRWFLKTATFLDIRGKLNVLGNFFVNNVLRISEIGHVRVGEFLESALFDPGDDVNTDDGKGRGSLGTNITDQAIVRAAGSLDASGWYGTYPDYFLTPGGEKVPLDVLPDKQPVVFETLDGFEAWDDALPSPAPNGAMAFVGGKELTKNATAGAIGAYINNWAPPDDVLTTNHVGTSSDIATDFKGVAEEMIDVAMNKGYVAYFEAPPDGSPFEYTYFRPTISGKVLRVRGDRNAEFYPVNSFQTFDTNGVQTVFVHSSILWDWEGPSEGYGAEFIYIDPDDLETKRVKLTIGVDIDVALNGSVYEWTVYLPVSVQEGLDGYDPEDPRIPLLDGGTLKIVSARGAFAVNAATGSGAELHWDGFFRLNVSRGGIAISSGGRSGFGHVGVDHIYHGGFIHTYGSALSGPDAAPIDQRGDGNYVPLGFLTMQGNGTVIGDYLCDVGGIYASGDGETTGETGDPIYCQLPNIVARNCALVLKDTRKIQSGFAPSVIGLDCKNFYVNAPQDGFQQGENFTMGYGRAVRTQRRVLDIRNNTGLIRINDLSIEDFGMETDGETPADGAHGIFLSGAKGVSCNVRATRRRWDAPSAALVTFDGDETQGNRIHGVARGYDNLVSNSVNDTLAAGNDVDIRHDGATTLYDATAAGIDNIRRKFTNILTDEVVEKSVFPVINTSPAFIIAGAVNSPTITMSTDPDPTLSDTVIEKRLDGDMMWFNLAAQGSVTHTETAKAFRILLDFSADNSAGNQIPLTVGRITGITPPSNTANLHAYIGDETNHIEFLWKIQGTGQTLLTTDHIASGATPVIQVSGIVPIAG